MQPEPAFVLHTRPYRETSLLVDFFTRNYGRFRAVARGARAAKIGTKKLNPYTQLLIGWAGKTELLHTKRYLAAAKNISCFLAKN